MSGDSVAAMIIVIDLSESRVLLQDPGGLHPLLGGDEGEGDLAEVVRQSGLGRLQGRRRARGRRPGGAAGAGRDRPRPTSGTRASPACATYAAGKGWVEPDGGIVAHVETRDEAG